MPPTPASIPASRLWPAWGFALTLVAPSTMVVHKYLGVGGVIAYTAVAAWLLVLLHRQYFARLVSALTPAGTIWLAAVVGLVLLAAFLIGYPVANSGLLGPGSDRDEHLEIATTELLHGRYPYYRAGPAGNPITQMPGMLLLAAPFVLLGSGAYQNLFWLAVFVAAVSWWSRDLRAALVLLVVLMLLSPAVLREYLAGGDLLANSIYVPVFAVWLVYAAGRAPRGWAPVAAAAAFGLGLSSRVHFLLIVPLVWAALRRRAGTGAAVRYLGIAGAVFALVTLPFYWYDPGGFWPFLILTYEDQGPETWLLDTLVLGIPAAVSLWCAFGRAPAGLAALLRACTLVLALVVFVTVFPAGIVDAGTPMYPDLLYGLSFIFFGAVGFMPPVPSGDPDARG